MRLTGPGMMKGESPVTQTEQTKAEIERYIRQHLFDSSGSLPLVLLRQVSNSELLLANFDQPLIVLACYVQHVLDSEYLLAELVRKVDTQWDECLESDPILREKDLRQIRSILTPSNPFASRYRSSWRSWPPAIRKMAAVAKLPTSVTKRRPRNAR